MQYTNAAENDVVVLQQFAQIKADNKKALAAWLGEKGVRVDPEAMFDIQIKRLHEYKRQQLNLLYLIHQYFEIKAGHTPAVPHGTAFSAPRRRPAYTIAKDIIHAILTLSKVIAADPEVCPLAAGGVCATTTTSPRRKS